MKRNIVDLLQTSYDWSVSAFGEGPRQEGVINHIKDELEEIHKEEIGSRERLLEWCDVLILAFNGAIRSGHTVEEVLDALECKVDFNLQRTQCKKYNNDGSIEVVKSNLQKIDEGIASIVKEKGKYKVVDMPYTSANPSEKKTEAARKLLQKIQSSLSPQEILDKISLKNP